MCVAVVDVTMTTICLGILLIKRHTKNEQVRIFYREQSQLESGIASIVNNLRCHASVFTQREKYQGKEKQRIETSFTQIPHPFDIIVNLVFLCYGYQY